MNRMLWLQSRPRVGFSLSNIEDAARALGGGSLIDKAKEAVPTGSAIAEKYEKAKEAAKEVAGDYREAKKTVGTIGVGATVFVAALAAAGAYLVTR